MASAVYAVAVVVFACAVCEVPGERALICLVVSTAVIVVGPPVWFGFEYWVLLSPAWRWNDKARSLVKTEQELPRNVWLSVAAICLATLSVMKDRILPKPVEPAPVYSVPAPPAPNGPAR